MALIIRQSTEITAKIGPFLDATDGVTEETGLAGGGTEISKNGGAYATGPTLGTHDAEGWYPITLTTTHTNTVGRLRVKSHNSATHLPVWIELQVIEEAVYDAMFAASATGLLPANVTQISGDSTAADNCEAFFDGTGYAGTNNVIPTVTTLTGHTAQTGDTYARLGAPAGASVSADVAAVKSDSAAILADTGTTLPATLSTIEGKIDTVDGVVDAILLDTDLIDDATSGLAKIATDVAAILVDTGTTLPATLSTIDGIVDTILVDTNELQTNQGDWATATGFSTLDAAGVRTAVGLASANLDTQLGALPTTAEVNAEVDTALADYDAPTNTEMAAAFTEIKGATWSSSTDTLEEIRDNVGGGGGGGDATEAKQDTIIAALGVVDGIVDDILVDTGTTLPAAIAGVGGAVGSGADAVTLTILEDDGSTPIADADIWISTDSAGSTVVAGTLQTNSLGKATFQLDAGVTYYRWVQKDGLNFTNPTSFVAVAD